MHKTHKILIIFLAAVLCLTIGFMVNNKPIQESILSDIITHEGIMPGHTEGEIKEILQKETDESSFAFEINTKPVFKDGNSEGNLKIANPPYNKYAISVDIQLDNNYEVIFQSGQIKPNHYIEYAKLDKTLEAGQYNATAFISAYDIESGELKGISAAKLIINIG